MDFYLILQSLLPKVKFKSSLWISIILSLIEKFEDSDSKKSIKLQRILLSFVQLGVFETSETSTISQL
jgi:hypothetical protein